VAGFALFKTRTFSFAVFRTVIMLMRCKVSDSSRHSTKFSRRSLIFGRYWHSVKFLPSRSADDCLSPDSWDLLFLLSCERLLFSTRSLLLSYRSRLSHQPALF